MTETEITKKDVQLLAAALGQLPKTHLVPDGETLADRKRFRKFRYAGGKNVGKLRDEMSGIVEEMKDFEDDRKVLCELHAHKDENGVPVTVQGRYQMKDDGKFTKALEELEEKHGIPVLYKETVKVNLHKISESCIPISLPQPLYMDMLLMVDDQMEEPEE